MQERGQIKGNGGTEVESGDEIDRDLYGPVDLKLQGPVL